MTKPVGIVTVQAKVPLWRDDAEAESIELICLEEAGFRIVAQKGLYAVGDKAVYVQPDYCLPDVALFESFIRPNGDPTKCRLGSNNRVRAIKFNFSDGAALKVFSQGILFPLSEVAAFLNVPELVDVDLAEALGVTKWEEPLCAGHARGLSALPLGIYKTDEENIENLWGTVKFPIHLIGTEKIDGSAITIFVKVDEELNIATVGVCSRTRNIDLAMDESGFVRVGTPYYKKLALWAALNGQSVALRGELYGASFKGSVTKHNPRKAEPANIRFYSVEHIDEYGAAARQSEERFASVIEELGFERCPLVFAREFESRAALTQACEEYFGTYGAEGVVVRDRDHAFSAKIMNLEYDSKK